ncbi:MAG TPA: DUF3598 family protein [Leptolyngbyaceae cyanobacterium]
MVSQWERLLKNSGTWIGSFTRLSPNGEQISDTPTEIALKPQGDSMRQEIRKLPPGEAPQETVLEYRSLGKGVLFCEDGAFSQGSIQWSPFGAFGAELGFIHGTERLRLVELFKGERTLSSLTLIREHLEGTQPQLRPPVSIDQLIGTWKGKAVTVYPDFQPEETYVTQLEIRREGCDRIHQTLQFGQSPPMQTVGTLLENKVQFDQGAQPVTVLLLPSGASATYPTHIESGKPLFLEAGWLITPTLRQRLIRTYNAQGTWVSLTLVAEQKTL